MSQASHHIAVLYITPKAADAQRFQREFADELVLLAATAPAQAAGAGGPGRPSPLPPCCARPTRLRRWGWR